MERAFVGFAALGVALCSAGFLGVSLTAALEPQVGLAGAAAVTGAVLALLACLILLLMRFYRSTPSALVDPPRPVALLRTLAKDQPFFVLGAAALFAIVELAKGIGSSGLVKKLAERRR